MGGPLRPPRQPDGERAREPAGAGHGLTRPRLTVVGSINLDLVARVERLPRHGETVTGAELARVPGGKGANQAVAAARLGADVRLVGRVGDDAFADEALAELERARVQLEVRRSGSTGVALILVAADGENQIVVVPGVNAELRPEDVRSEGAVLCQLEIPVETVEAVAETAGRFFFNAAPARDIPAAVVERAELVVVNRHEREALAAEPRLLALTLGAEGAGAAPPPVEPVDGTAAGDAFTAAMVVSLLEGRPREEALRRACAAGALAASRFGAQPSLPTAAELEALLAG